MISLFLVLFAANTEASSEPASEPVIVAPKPSGKLNIFLLLEENRLKEVVEVATKRATRIERVPAIVSVLTAEQIQQMGIQTLAELLEFSAGVLLVGHPNALKIPVVRGFATENGVSVLIDGVPILDIVSGQFAHYDMPLAGFKRVEILRGPGSALHGGNAQAAVINLVSQQASEQATEVGGAAGHPLTLRGRASFGTSIGKGYSLSATGTIHRTQGITQLIPSDAVLNYADPKILMEHPTYPPFQSLIDPRNPAYIGNTRAEPSIDGTAMARFETPFGLRASSTFLAREVSPLVNPSRSMGVGFSAVTAPGTYLRKDLLWVNELNYRRKWWNDRLEMVASLRYVLNRRAQAGTLTGPLYEKYGVWAKGRIERLGYLDNNLSHQVEFHLSLPAHNALLIGGLISYSFLDDVNFASNYTSTKIGGIVVPGGGSGVTHTPEGVIDQTGQAFILPHASRLLVSAFAQDVFSPLRWLDVIGGVRVDWYDDFRIVSDPVLAQDRQCASLPRICKPLGVEQIYQSKPYTMQASPRAGVVLTPSVSDKLDLSLKVLYGRGFTPPPINALTNQTFSEASSSSPTLGNVILRSTVSDTFEAGAALGLLKQHSLRLTYFHIRTADEVVFSPERETFMNNASRVINGLELELQGDQAFAGGSLRLMYRGGVSWQGMKALSGTLVGIGADIYPPIIGFAWVGAELWQKLGVGASVHLASKAQRETSDPRPDIPGRAIVNLNLRVTNLIRFVELGAIVRDVADTRYHDPLPRFVGVDEDYPRGGRTVLGYILVRL